MVEWTGTMVLETERLTLRTFRRDDLPRYAAMNADAEVVRYLGGPLTREASDEIAEWANHLHATEGVGFMAVERRADGAFLGACGLHHLESFPDDLEIAWRLAREHWGHGYATEAASAWVGHGFSTLDLARVISICDPPNTRSVAVMRRLGMTLESHQEVEEEGQRFEVLVYAIDRDRWLPLPDGLP